MGKQRQDEIDSAAGLFIPIAHGAALAALFAIFAAVMWGIA